MFTFDLKEIETRIMHDNEIFNADFILDRWENGTDSLGTDDYGDYEAVLKESSEVMTESGFMEKWADFTEQFESFRDFIEDSVNVEVVRSGNTYNGADLDVTNKHWIEFSVLDVPFFALRLHKYGDVRGNYTQFYIIEDVGPYARTHMLYGGYITGHIEFTDGTEATIDAQQSSDVYYWQVNDRMTDEDGQAERFRELADQFDSWNFDEVIFDMLLHGSYETDKLDPLTESEQELQVARNNPNQKSMDV